MTIKIYDERPYETEWNSSVISCQQLADKTFEVVLDETIFFPEEGGQTPDQGILRKSDGTEVKVLDVQIREEIIYHVVSGEIPVGEKVQGVIDWSHRFSNMQNHTGEHIFSGLVYKRFGYHNVGFHLSDSEVTMDYDGALTKEEIQEIEQEVNRIIFLSLPVICEYPSEEKLKELDYRSKKELSGAIRIVTIPDVDVCACCAPHVRTTSEIGMLKVVSSMNYKGGTRLSILCGMRAYELFCSYQEELTTISQQVKTPRLETASAVEKLLTDKVELQQQIMDQAGKLLQYKIAELSGDTKNAYVFTDPADVNLLRRTANDLSETYAGYSGIFWPEGEGYRYIIAASKLPESECKDANLPNKNLREAYGARGGGKPEMVQGSVIASEEQIRQALHI